MPEVLTKKALIQLVEMELVNQFQRFMRKYLVQVPATCRFNIWEKTPEGGQIRVCTCQEAQKGHPCTTINHAKKCTHYQHFTAAPVSMVPQALAQDFVSRVLDPEKRAAQFKTLHTLWLFLHEMEVQKLSFWTRWQLKWYSKLYTRLYEKKLARSTPKIEADWTKLLSNFLEALNKTSI